MNIKKLLLISPIKTVLMNKKYFGWRGVIHPYIVCSRYVNLEKLNGKIIIDKNQPAASIVIGFPGVSIFDNERERAIWDNSGEIRIKGKVRIGGGVRISNSGILSLNNKVNIMANSTIICKKQIEIGEESLISWNVTIMDTDFHKIYGLDDDLNQVNCDKEIIIERRVWICSGATILKGTYIPESCVVASNSLISKRLTQKNCCYVNGGSIVRSNITWKP